MILLEKWSIIESERAWYRAKNYRYININFYFSNLCVRCIQNITQ
jgi:hypothetical protein